MAYEQVYRNEKYTIYDNEHNSLLIRKHNPEFATVVAVQEGSLVVVKQYREAIGATTYELPGGGMKAGEDPQDAARRELLEETGLVCGEITPLGAIVNFGGLINTRSHLYFTADILAEQSQQLDIDEDIELVRVPVDEAFAKIADGTYPDSELAHGLLLASLKGLL